MNEKYVDSFYKATQDVFALMLDMQAEKEALQSVDKMATKSGANVTIGITGDIAGTVLFTFPKETALEIVKIMAGMEMDKLDSFVVSALSEMVNIISGNAVTNLANDQYSCDIVPPEIVDENKVIPIHSHNALRLPLNTDIGNFEMSLYLKENTV